MPDTTQASLGDFASIVGNALSQLESKNTVSRIWNIDHTVWKPDPTEISDRLGWLTVTDFMREHIGEITGLADEVGEAGYQHVVLLGMGGSSLGPEVLKQTFGNVEGYPSLIVLDSTVPAWVQSVTDSIDPEKTLFLVSSKSGTTIEPNVAYKYFRSLVEKAVGAENAGQHFAAVTDPGSVLENLGQETGFRKVFPNPTDIGGRYSVQSYFGLVPAALAGIDVTTLIDRVDAMRKQCSPEVPVADNPGARLGAVIGSLASRGIDKLTLVTSPAVASFGLWVEQLIAESTGKEGKGIVPVAGEPLSRPEGYGDDRLFVYMRLDDDDNEATDAIMKAIEDSGQPVIRLTLSDKYDLGGEFYRWEFATAVAGAVIGIQPFDQPNVQQSKDMTNLVLDEFKSSGNPPSLETTGSIKELLSQARVRDYLAIMVYSHQTRETDEVLSKIRHKVMERYQIATTLGYGPRFLHSTGQLHKGGPNTGLFLQLTQAHEKEIAIPDEPFTFGILADAQAKGDFDALKSQGRRAISVNIGTGGTAAIEKLLEEIA